MTEPHSVSLVPQENPRAMSIAANPNEIEVILTAQGTGARLSRQGPVPLGSGAMDQPQPATILEVDPSTTFQTIEGFGGAFTEAAADTLSRVSPALRAEVLRAYFDPQTGLNYTLCRTHINSCDFALGNYSYCDVPGDTRLAHFDISRDRRLLIPLIRDAMALRGGDLRLLASPWSPPAWMKTNGEMNRGGRLLPEHRDAWALYYAKYIRAYRAEGIPIWAVTVQNEPEAAQTWDSCLYTAEEERDFVRDFLGPRLQRENLSDVKILIWDHNRDVIVERADTVLRDPEAAKYVWGVAFHWYCGEQFANLDHVHRMHPATNLLFTEGCCEGGPHLGEWATGERYGHHMIGDLSNWTVGWMDWNMVLDETGGPNHVGNFCSAPIIADTKSDALHYQSSYYHLGQFSRYVMPGAVRVGLTGAGDTLEAVAFRNPDHRVAVVVLNRSDTEIPFGVRLGGRSARLSSPGHSIMTLVV